MKITSIDLMALTPEKSAAMRPIVCRVNTDEGIYGLGEAGVAIVTGARGAYELMRDYAALLIGQNPLHNEVLWERLFKGTFWAQGNGPIVMAAISALDTALWDIRGKAYNAPLYELLGGKHRDKLRCYASQLQFGWGVEQFQGFGDTAGFVEAAQCAVAQGYDAIKLNFFQKDAAGRKVDFRDTTGSFSKKLLRLAEERIDRVRAAVGPDVDILLENHAMTDLHTAIQLGRVAQPYDILYYEEPATPLNADVFKTISEKVDIPLATGERTFTRWGFLPLLRNGSIALAQPDVGNCGGVTECKKICDLAHLYDVGIQTHTCSGPISVAVSLQVEAAVPNFVIHEHHVSNTMRANTDLGRYNYQPKDGYFEVPELPGIGQELSEYALRTAEIETVR